MGHPLTEALDIDDEPLVSSFTDQLDVVTSLEAKGEPSSFHFQQLSADLYLEIDRRRRQVSDIQVSADGAIPLRQEMVNRSHAGPLHEQNHLGRSQHLRSAAAHVGGRVLLGDDQRRLACQARLDRFKGQASVLNLGLGFALLAGWFFR